MVAALPEKRMDGRHVSVYTCEVITQRALGRK